MSLLLTTTGNSSPVVISDLGDRSFTHPTTDINLEDEYDLQTLLDSEDLRSALVANDITLTFDGYSITATQFDAISRGNMNTFVYDTNENSIVDIDESGAGTNAIDYSFILNRANHIGTQLAATISDFKENVLAYMYLGTSGYALDSQLLDGRDITYILNRFNHTNTQLAATISDFKATVLQNIYDGTSGYALDSQLLDGRDITYVLSRFNHTDTQVANTISDFTEAARQSISIEANSLDYLSYNSTSGQISVDSALKIKVDVDNINPTLEDWAISNYSGIEYQEGDIIIISAHREGQKVYVHSDGKNSTSGLITGTYQDFTEIQAPNIDPVYIITTANLVAGDFVNIYDSGGENRIRKADGSNYLREAHGYVKKNYTIGQTALVYLNGLNTYYDNLISGKSVWLYASTSGGSVGGVQQFTPFVDTYIYQVLGTAITPTTIDVKINKPIQISSVGDVIVIDKNDGRLREIDNSEPVEIGDVVFTGSFSLGPAKTVNLTGNINNFDPELESINVLRITSNGNYSITGLLSNDINNSTVVYVFNVGVNNITFKDNNSASLAQNRFILGTSKTVQSDEGIILVYDTTSQRWRAPAINI